MTEAKVNKVADASDFEIADDASVEIELYNPRTKQGTNMFFTVYSRDSDVAKKVLRKQQDRRLLQMKRSRGGINLTSEELENERFEFVVACVKSIRNVKWHGAEVVCDHASLRELFEKAPPIMEQVQDAIDERALFAKG